MNQLGIELYKQAAEFAYNTIGKEHANTLYFQGVIAGKFAELIVTECADQCDLLLDHKISSEWARGTHDCSLAIRKKFEVNLLDAD